MQSKVGCHSALIFSNVLSYFLSSFKLWITAKVFLDVFVLLCLVSDSSWIVLFLKSQNGDKAISHLSLLTICLCLSSCSALNTLLSATPNPAVKWLWRVVKQCAGQGHGWCFRCRGWFFLILPNGKRWWLHSWQMINQTEWKVPTLLFPQPYYYSFIKAA